MMAMPAAAISSSSSLHFFSSSSSTLHSAFKTHTEAVNPWRLNPVSMKSQEPSQNRSGSKRQVWRRRKLSKNDDRMRYKMDRTPFLEEQVNEIRRAGKLLSMDIERLLSSEDNRFDFVNEVAAEAKEYVENNRDEYGSKKAVLHVLSNRMNDTGYSRPDAYLEPDPFKPGTGLHLPDDLI